MEEKRKTKRAEDQSCYGPMLLSMGVAMGTAIGVSVGNLSLWLCLGVFFGLCICSGLDAGKKSGGEGAAQQEKEDSQS